MLDIEGCTCNFQLEFSARVHRAVVHKTVSEIMSMGNRLIRCLAAIHFSEVMR